MNSDSLAQAEELLDEVTRVRRTTRSALHGLWFPLVLFGVLSCVSAVVSWRLGGDSLGVYWAVAAPLGSGLTGLFYHRQEQRVGLEVPVRRWLPGVVIILVGAFSTGLLGGALGAEMVSAVGPPLFVSLGYLFFARMERSVPLAIVAAALAALAMALAFSGGSADLLATVLAAAYGIAFVGTGLALRRQRYRAA